MDIQLESVQGVPENAVIIRSLTHFIKEYQ